MYTHDELVDIVSAANISGNMEHAGRIDISDDEDLLGVIEKEYAKWRKSCGVTMENSNGVTWWYDWIESALLRKFGRDQ